MSWKTKVKIYDDDLNVIKETNYACGGCGKKRIKMYCNKLDMPITAKLCKLCEDGLL